MTTAIRLRQSVDTAFILAVGKCYRVVEVDDADEDCLGIADVK